MKKLFIALIAFYVLLYILPLGVRPVIIPDESRYAEIPREMLASGDWIVPRLNGLRYFEKPVMSYWVNAASMLIFGQNNWSIRLASALSAGISALWIFFLVGRYAGGPRWAGLLAAAVLLTCMEFFAVGVFNVPDGLLTMFLTAAMVSFYLSYQADRSGKKLLYQAVFGAFCSLAFLTKGFLAFAVPVVAITPFMIWEGRWRQLFSSAVVPIASAILVALPWALMIHAKEGDFWQYFFWTEHIQRFMSDNPQHPEPFWYFLPVMAAGALPWTYLIPAVARGFQKPDLKDSLIRYALCWFVFPFLFFSASSGKLGTYILPCFPPFAILIARGLLKYLSGEKRRAFNIGIWTAVVISGLLALAVFVSQGTPWREFKVYAPDETWKWVLAVTALLFWALLSALAGRKAGPGKKLFLFCVAPLLFMFGSHFITPQYSREDKAPGELLMHHAHRIDPGAPLVSDRDLISAVCWFYQRDDVYLLEAAGELKYGLGYPDSKHRLLSFDQFKALVDSNENGAPVTLITTSNFFAKLVKYYRPPKFEDSAYNFTIGQY